MINRKSNEMLFINWKKRRGMILSIFVMFMLCIPSVTMLVKAADIIVDDDGTGDYLTIQDAIDAASAGDTIWVKDGSYNEQLNVHTSVGIIADNGAEPIIYVTSYSPGIDVTASNTTIEGFKIYGNSNLGGGPVIRASAGADVLGVKNNLFVAISGETGNIALQVVSGVSEVEFTSNSVTEYNIGVSLQDNCVAQISGSFTHVNYPVYHAAQIDGINTYYGSIQDAIDAADVGDTVYVTEGTYTNPITINKSIALSRYGGNNPIVDLGSVATYAIEFEQGCDGAMIDGLEVINSNGIYVNLNAGGEGNVTIQNNDMHDLFVSGVATGGFFVDAACWPPLENWTIKNNVFENITGSLSSGLRPENMKNLIISGNTISNMGYSGILLINVDGATVSNNVVTNISRAGIQVDSYCTRTIDISDNVITRANTGSHSGYGAIRFYGQHIPDPHGDPPAEITLIDNICNDSYNGLAVRDGENISGRNISAHDTSFINNSNMGVYHNGSGILNATNNWWGNISGPYHPISNPDGTGQNVSDNVTFWPWYEFDGYSIPPSVDYDIEGPQVSYGEIIRGTTEIEINAEDDESGMYSLTYRIWNTTHRWGPWTNYTDPFTLPGQGNHRVQYNATDNAGTSAYPNKPWGYYERHRVDDVSPTTNVVYPNGGEFEYGVITIEWTSADRIFDQGQLQQNGSIPLTEDYPGHIQSFTPTEDSIDSVQLLISGDDANVSVKLFNEIYPVPTVIGQSVKRIQNIGAPAWIDFPFSSSINLDTTKTYYIGVTQQIYGDTGFVWYYLNDSVIDGYPFGHAWVKEIDALVNESSMDFAFKTMYWDTDIDISVKYTNIGIPPWSTISEGELNDGIYPWDTVSYGIPDGPNYRIKIEAIDEISNIGYDESDENFIIDNEGPGVYNINITDTTISDSFFTKNGDNIEITASISGDPETITADLSGFGKGTEVNCSSFTGGIAKWTVTDILCSPPNGVVSVTITVRDATGDSGSNTGTITADNAKPTILITKPGPGFYFLDSMRLLPFSYPFIIGQITFETEASDDGSGVSQVEFYLENDLEATVTEPPYRWLWDYVATGFFDVEVKAVDRVGHETSDEITDLFIINLDIIGHE